MSPNKLVGLNLSLAAALPKSSSSFYCGSHYGLKVKFGISTTWAFQGHGKRGFECIWIQLISGKQLFKNSYASLFASKYLPFL